MEPKKEEEQKVEKKEEETKTEPPKPESPKKEDPKEKEEAQQENAVEDKPEETEIPVKKEINQEIGIKNMVGDDVKFKEVNTWEQLGVKESIIKGLLEMSFLTPSKVQSTTFPIIMKEPRFNLIAQAKNGSGKTCAFGLGAISSIDEDNKNIQAVVFAHTRELVIQVHDVLSKIEKHTKVKVTAPLSQEETNDYGQIIVITPGHFENCFLKRKKDDLLSNLKMLVLDEADYMLTNEVTSKVCEKAFKIFKKKGMNVQILFFSATFELNCFKFIRKFYENAYIIELKKEELTLDNVKQLYKECNSPDEKVNFIEQYLPLNPGSQRVIIFANRRDNVVKLQQKLLEKGYKVYILMGGDMAAQNRDETIKRFRNGEIQILISTDVLSRGYDERLVKLVINFDMPVKKLRDGKYDVDYDTYLHRIGRTGRFGTKGIGINLICGMRDMENMLKIEKYYQSKIEKMKTMYELVNDLQKCVIED
jgi:ATP-dependent RNA helicase DDX19/DBP5